MNIELNKDIFKEKIMEITNENIADFLKDIEAERLKDILIIIDLMRQITAREPKLWGTIIGFGKLYYKYPTGHDGFMPILGLANRKQAITLYLSFDLQQYEDLKKLGTYKVGKSCLYIKKLTDINIDILHKIMKKAYEEAIHYSFVKVIE
jgi:hypothetical protein